MVVPASPKREQVLKLIAEKDKIEKQISDYGNVLSCNQLVGMDQPLVDSEGFPRNDIDIFAVRNARHQINCLQNDLKELMKEIEKGLEAVHAEGASNLGSTKLAPEMDIDQASAAASSNQELTPIVVVNLVSLNSPGHDAGIKVGDKIISFGTINSTNYVILAQIGVLVNNCKDQIIKVSVLRSGEIVDLKLTPKSWSGRGLLGFNIVPYDPSIM